MNTEPMERYTIVKNGIYPSGEKIYEPIVDGILFSSLEDANRYLQEVYLEEIRRYSEQAQGVAVYGQYTSTDGGYDFALIYDSDHAGKVSLDVRLLQVTLEENKEREEE